MNRPRPCTSVGLLAAAALLVGCANSAPRTGSLATALSEPTPVAPAPLTSSFTSPMYGYSIKHPVTFNAKAATAKLTGAAALIIEADNVDVLSGPVAFVVMAAPDVQAGLTLQRWTADTATGYCGDAAATEAIEINGEPATMSTYSSCGGLFHLWVTAVRDGSGYHIVWVNQRGTEVADRALFESMLATFEFDASSSPTTSARSGRA
jgi:hypothetical protein